MLTESQSTPPILEIKNLNVNYGGIQALQNLDLIVRTGEVITLIG